MYRCLKCSLSNGVLVGGLAEEEGEFAGAAGRVSAGLGVMNASRIHIPFIAIIEAVGR